MTIAPKPRPRPTHTWLSTLLLTPITLLLEPTRPVPLGPELDLTLRSAFGAAFSRAACTRPPRDCGRCDLTSSCLIPTWFERPVHQGHGTRVYALHTDAGAVMGPGRPLRLQVMLFGPLPDPMVILESLRDLAATGVGEARVPLRIRALRVGGAEGPVEVMRDDVLTGAWPAPASAGQVARWPRFRPVGARVHLRTPAQLDKPVREPAAPSPEELLMRMIRRVHAVAELQDLLVVRWPDPTPGLGAWEWVEWADRSRWSQRSDERLDLSGWVGTAIFGEGILEFVELLAVAELLGVGRHTTTGAGVIKVEWL
jgi:hypothetical protein